ncbi:MAG: S41 family peptidase [Bacteroidales bacterium]|nr:S41 family peptidase [Bacteroidales bacterium]
MKRLLYILPLLFIFSGCENILIDEPDTSHEATFEYLWETIDREYALFDVKNVDWDSVYTQYSATALAATNEADFFKQLASMLNLLNDGHVNLISSFDVSRSEEVFLQTYGRRNIDLPTVALNYLRADYHSTGGLSYNTLRDGRVLYIRYASFSSSVSTAQLQMVLKRFPKAEGVVFDVRQNGGGTINNIWHLLSVMPGHGQLLYSTQIKSGPGHNDFSEPESVIAPEAENPYNKPVVVLTDRGSYSATSFFALSCRSYPNITIVGDTTGGGLGLPKGRQLPNGWYVRYSVTRTLAPDGTNYENGVPPHEVVILDPTETAIGRDNVIERACDIILNQP